MKLELPVKILAALAMPLIVVAGDLPQPTLLNGYVIPPGTVSPSNRYGVSVFDNTVNPIPDEIEDNNLIELSSGRVIGRIDADAGIMHMNHGGILPARWSKDSSLLLWEVDGKWSPRALTLLKVDNGKIQWQLKVLEAAQQAILSRTRAAAPAKYAAARKYNHGSGSAYPDGFTINVRVEGDKERGGPKENVKGKPISLPLKVHAELTSNPKEMEWPEEAQLDSELDCVIGEGGVFTVSRFKLRKKPFSDACATSWLELTNPTAAKNAPLEYGDVVSLEGKLTKKGESHVLLLRRPVSILASDEFPAEGNVSEIRLLGFERWGNHFWDQVENPTNFEATGILGYVVEADQSPRVTINSRY